MTGQGAFAPLFLGREERVGARNGIGHSLFLSWTFLDTPSLFAWIIVTFGLLGLVEFGVLRPARDRIMRWKVSP